MPDPGRDPLNDPCGESCFDFAVRSTWLTEPGSTPGYTRSLTTWRLCLLTTTDSPTRLHLSVKLTR